jgi:hypothetical protein
MTYRGMTNHIRDRIAHEGIEASVRGHRSRGLQWIVVEAKQPFTQRQCQKIALIASLNGLTYARGEPIDSSDAHWSDRPECVSQFMFVDGRKRVSANSYDSAKALAHRRSRQQLHVQPAPVT